MREKDINVVKCAKFKIVNPLTIDWETFNSIYRELSKESQIIKNETTTICYEWEVFSRNYYKNNGVNPMISDWREDSISNKGKSYSNVSGYAYHCLQEKYDFLLSGNNVAATANETYSKFNKDKKEIFRGDATVQNFKYGQPVNVKNKNIFLSKDDGGKYLVTVNIISKKRQKEYDLSNGKISFQVTIGSNNSLRSIFEKCLSGEYDICSSKITKDNKEMFFMLSYRLSKEKPILDGNRIMGIDLGICYPAYMAVNFDSKYESYISDDTIIPHKIRLEKELSASQSARKFALQGNKGHGYKKVHTEYYKYSNKASNFSKRKNDEYSSYIIKQALKMRCGVIQMEDLKGISDTSSTFLKSWTYYDLQQKISNKSAENGIIVNKVNPKYTSQRCSVCGNIDSDNRKTQSEFCCTKCGAKMNADFNAARNISISNIEDLIDSELHIKEKYSA